MPSTQHHDQIGGQRYAFSGQKIMHKSGEDLSATADLCALSDRLEQGFTSVYHSNQGSTLQQNSQAGSYHAQAFEHQANYPDLNTQGYDTALPAFMPLGFDALPTDPTLDMQQDFTAPAAFDWNVGNFFDYGFDSLPSLPPLNGLSYDFTNPCTAGPPPRQPLPLLAPAPTSPAPAPTATHSSRLTCPKGCRKTFTRPADYRRHMAKHDAPKFKCAIIDCDKTFYRADKLRAHLKQGHKLKL